MWVREGGNINKQNIINKKYNNIYLGIYWGIVNYDTEKKLCTVGMESYAVVLVMRLCEFFTESHNLKSHKYSGVYCT